MSIITQTTYADVRTDSAIVRDAFHRLNNAGRGFDGEDIEAGDYYAHVATVDAGTDSELRVFTVDRDDNDWCYIVGDVDGPWAVRFELAREWTSRDLADQYHANLFSLPSEYDHDALSDIHDEINGQLQSENEWLEWDTFRDWAAGQLREVKPYMAE